MRANKSLSGKLEARLHNRRTRIGSVIFSSKKSFGVFYTNKIGINNEYITDIS